MNNNIAALFDLDGVIIDTEPQYDVFWKQTGEKYQLGIENFEKLIKGTILPNIVATYFSHFPESVQKEIEAGISAFELQMDMIPVPGALEFLAELKKAGIKTGLVTSSNDEKLAAVFRALPIRDYFDTLVTADRVTQGKPDPMCYLLAAKDLNVPPENCFVFEDSFNGIQSGKAAGMKVIGLSTTNPAESIEADCLKVIPDFRQLPGHVRAT
ncbi:MAG: HAD family phosphatase [Candidatus Symbiothrix sp.]|jgi:HAD superfamily hydrolase (TIGR01509 family)|nr:HAD family phosphatase [Candidatus Symbiothrix sp.]